MLSIPTPLLGAFILVLLVAFALLLYLIHLERKYKESAYYQVTKLSYFRVLNDPGRYGEFLTYQHLKDTEQNGAKFLFNVYIPKKNGATTEIDVLMICSKGILVFESKNYSGWIFGNDSQPNWYQTLPTGRGKSHKESFYNPIMQNRSHIKHLKSLLGDSIPMHSIVVFSQKSILKDVQINSTDTTLINGHYLLGAAIANIYSLHYNVNLSQLQIEEIYNTLYPYTQIGADVKAQHCENIKNAAKSTPTYHTPDYRCPWCNGSLVLRTSKNGNYAGNQFYGCSNYPKCKYIQNLK